MELWEAIKARKSIRVFKKDPVPKELVEKLLKAGIQAPSSANIQPWEFVVVCGKKRDELSQLLIASFRSKGKNYDFEGKKSQFPEKFLERRKKLFNGLFQELKNIGVKDPEAFLQGGTYRFYGAPILILVFMDGRLAKRYLFDVGMCVQNILLAAEAEGLGTHVIGLILRFQETIKKSLNIASEKKLVAGICLGYADLGNAVNRFRAYREPLEQLVTWMER